MAIKRYLKNKKVEYIKFKPEDEDAKDQRIKRLESLVESLTRELSSLLGADAAVAPCSSYTCYQ